MEKISFEEYRKLIATIHPTDHNCPIKRTLELFTGKWNLIVLYELTKADSLRFGNLQKRIDGITNTMLSSTLKDLEKKGFVIRTQFNEIPPHVEYALSESGKGLYTIFIEMANWAEKYHSTL
jgi:DNA-binding HxlR family transcriptional regulator